MTPEQMARIKKAEAMRWRKPVHKELRWEAMTERLWEIRDACSEVQWMAEDEEILLEALDGDEDVVFELRMAFSDLVAECERMSEEMEELQRYQTTYGIGTDDDGEEEPGLFNYFFAATDRSGDLYGYDEVVEDYMPIQHFSVDYARETAAKVLKRLTKDQLIACAGMCLDIARNYLALTNRYDHISGAIDILRGQNEGYLTMVKHLEETYEAAEKETDGFRYDFSEALRSFEHALREVPDRLWIE